MQAGTYCVEPLIHSNSSISIEANQSHAPSFVFRFLPLYSVFHGRSLRKVGEVHWPVVRVFMRVCEDSREGVGLPERWVNMVTSFFHQTIFVESDSLGFILGLKSPQNEYVEDSHCLSWAPSSVSCFGWRKDAPKKARCICSGRPHSCYKVTAEGGCFPALS